VGVLQVKQSSPTSSTPECIIARGFSVFRSLFCAILYTGLHLLGGMLYMEMVSLKSDSCNENAAPISRAFMTLPKCAIRVQIYFSAFSVKKALFTLQSMFKW
jgi:hypothetical protein